MHIPSLLLTVSIACIGLATGCSSKSQDGDPFAMKEAVLPKPDDFTIEYQWREGAVPPPDHYAYTIRINRDAEGEIEFRPDYPREDVPVWKESFAVDEKALERIYGLMVDCGMFRETWETDERIPPGDSIETLDVISQGNHVHVPGNIKNPVDMNELYNAIRGLVPQAIWKSLMARRDQYANNGCPR